ncbi:MAG: substrate-binding domain-containing protein [Fimbriimonas sp.]
MKIKALGFAAAMVAALMLVGCGDSGGSSSSTTGGGAASGGGKAKYRVAVIPKGATHEFWKSIHQGANEAAAESNGQVEVIWKGPQLENDRENQIKVVEDFLNQGISGIVLAPLDDKALVPVVKQANKNEIPVVIIDSALNGGEYASFVSTDNEKGGGLAGEEMVKRLNGKGRILVLRYQEGSASTMAREKGFLDAIAKAPGITVVDSTQYAGPTTETAQKAGENLLARFKKPDGSLDVDGIYTPNESSTFGMLRVLQDNKWAGKVTFVGFDSSEKLIDGLKSDEIAALVVQNPRRMGYLGVKTILDVLEKKPVEKQVDTGAVLVTKENMTTPDVTKLLEAPKE